MHKALIAIKLAFFLFVFDQRVDSLEYSLINHIVESREIKGLNGKFYSPNKGRFTTYGEYSLAFSHDLLDPSKTFDLDRLFSNDQKIEFEEKLKVKKIDMIDKSKIRKSEILSGEIGSAGANESSGIRLSYPVIQKGLGNNWYGFLFEDSSHGESGGITLKIYRLEGNEWTLLHETLVSIS
jgi:hypothetical protein